MGSGHFRPRIISSTGVLLNVSHVNFQLSQVSLAVETCMPTVSVLALGGFRVQIFMFGAWDNNQ